jgi:hypothetical protein
VLVAIGARRRAGDETSAVGATRFWIRRAPEVADGRLALEPIVAPLGTLTAVGDVPRPELPDVAGWLALIPTVGLRNVRGWGVDSGTDPAGGGRKSPMPTAPTMKTAPIAARNRREAGAAMRRLGSIWPSRTGIAVSKDVWMLGIGLSLLADGLG